MNQVRLFHFRLPLHRPLVLRHVTLQAREGLIVELRDENGVVGYGECSPLPGFFPETLAEAKGWIIAYQDLLLREDISDAPKSVQSAVDQARFWIKCQREDVSPVQSTHCIETRLPVNALLTGTRDEIMVKAAQCAKDGFLAAKLKVGRQNVTDDCALVQDVLATLPPTVSLRLDANQSWSFDDALEFSRRVNWESIEYCEEPLADPHELPRLLTAVPDGRFALDESFTQFGESMLEIIPNPSAIILRPQLLGGIRHSLSLKAQIEARGIATVVSSAVESSLGLMSVMLCALAPPAPLRPAGLDTLSWFSKDSITPSLKILNGCIDWPTWWNSIKINDQAGEWRDL